MPQNRFPRPRGADAATALILGLVTVLNPRAFTPEGTAIAAAIGEDAVLPLFWAFLLVCIGAIMVRTRHPQASVISIEAALALHLVLFDSLSIVAVAACLVAAETIGSRIARPWSWALLAVMALGSAVTVLRVSPLFNEEVALWSRLLFVLVTAWSLIGAAYLWGVNRRRARDRVEQALTRARELAAHAEEAAAHAEDRRRLAVAEERQRIARDVHDLLGHSLAVIGMQAEGARAVLGADPSLADEALATIGRMSRVGVDEVRRLVDVLREDAEEEGSRKRRGEGPDPAQEAPRGSAGAPGRERAAEDAPCPRALTGGEPARGRGGLAGLVELVEPLCTAGAGTRLSVEADSPLPLEAQEAASGILREALSNAVRHGAAPILVGLRVDAEGIELSVSSAPSPRGSAPAGRTGTGLSSMHERAEAVGGRLEAGPGDDGRWLVTARLPMHDSESTGDRE